MDFGHDIKRINVEHNDDDRLSCLPQDLVYKILSFIGIKHVVQTSVLSSKWRFVWMLMPCLDFSTEDFPTVPKFVNFVTHVLSGRNNMVDVFSLELRYCEDVSQELVNQIINYAFSHNIQRLKVTCLMENNIEYSLPLFSSRSLKHLTLTKEFSGFSMISAFSNFLKVTSTWELQSLTTLYLHDVTFCSDDRTDDCVDLFSNFANLKNLTLEDCKTKGLKSVRIFHPRLFNLTLYNGHDSWEVFHVDAPQLENLTISNWSREHYVVSAPKLSSLHYRGCHHLHLSTNGFHSLEKVDLCVTVYREDYVDARGIVSLFQKFKSVKYLKLNMEIVELLSSYVELVSHHPSPFNKLKRLKIYPVAELLEEEEQNTVKISTDVKSYLLDNSPDATFTMVTREEVRNMKNIKLTKNLMAELRVLLDKEKAKIETNRAHMEQEKTQVDNKLQSGRRIKHVNRCWKDLTVQIKQGKSKTADIISRLEEIKGLLTKLPVSRRAEMEACFPSLRAEADEVVNNILDHMKSKCDMNGSHFSVYLR
uniref:putative F-box/FBD/LRR-repeat protein At4g03220 n=1 Tax=Erigeron canadensis TaxID=72917 RepID=UPI001CB943BC|nr:putative F-box/FBD/LRR-repeat protein At4g03220 [Erigeron canadensis]